MQIFLFANFSFCNLPFAFCTLFFAFCSKNAIQTTINQQLKYDIEKNKIQTTQKHYPSFAYCFLLLALCPLPFAPYSLFLVFNEFHRAQTFTIFHKIDEVSTLWIFTHIQRKLAQWNLIAKINSINFSSQ